MTDIIQINDKGRMLLRVARELEHLGKDPLKILYTEYKKISKEKNGKKSWNSKKKNSQESSNSNVEVRKSDFPLHAPDTLKRNVRRSKK